MALQWWCLGLVRIAATLAVLLSCSSMVEPGDLGPIPVQQDRMAIAASTTCALDSEGVPSCWEPSGAPSFSGLETVRLVTVSGTWDHFCGLGMDSTAYCWGQNQYGQVGDGSRTRRTSPARVAADIKFIAIVAAVHATCGLDGTGLAYCWGRNDYGALGNGPTAEGAVALVPEPVRSNLRFTAISGGWPICALDSNGVAYCWGSIPGSFNPIHIEPGDCAATYWLWFAGKGCTRPTALAGGLRFQEVSREKCGLDSQSAAWCWGDGWYGQLGNGKAGVSSVAPARVSGGHRYVALSSGVWHTCGLDLEGQAFCWGYNTGGQLGNGQDGGPDLLVVVEAEPVAVTGGQRFERIAAGNHTCSVTSAGVVWCWGPGYGNVPVRVTPRSPTGGG